MQGVTAMKYDITVTREGRWWMVEVPALDLLTQARRVSEIETMAREIIAVTLDVKMSEVEVHIAAFVVDGVDMLAVINDVRSKRDAAERAEREAGEAMREAVQVLTSHSAPVRDVGELLGVSHQRVSQLAH
jgi:hypothetical protein